MDFHSLTRKELQTLCKKNKIPANITNVAMADALKALETVEGLDEIINQSQSPEKTMNKSSQENPSTVTRTSTRSKTAKEEPLSAQPTTRTRRMTRKAVESEEENKNVNVPDTPDMSTATTRRRVQKTEPQVEEQKNSDLLQTPALQSGRRRAAVGSTRRKVEAQNAERSVQHSYGTRRSARLLEKCMAGLSLKESGRMEPVKIDEMVEDVVEEKNGQSEVTSEVPLARNLSVSLEDESDTKDDDMETSKSHGDGENDCIVTSDAGSERSDAKDSSPKESHGSDAYLAKSETKLADMPEGTIDSKGSDDVAVSEDSDEIDSSQAEKKLVAFENNKGSDANETKLIEVLVAEASEDKPEEVLDHASSAVATDPIEVVSGEEDANHTVQEIECQKSVGTECDINVVLQGNHASDDLTKHAEVEECDGSDHRGFIVSSREEGEDVSNIVDASSEIEIDDNSSSDNNSLAEEGNVSRNVLDLSKGFIDSSEEEAEDVSNIVDASGNTDTDDDSSCENSSIADEKEEKVSCETDETDFYGSDDDPVTSIIMNEDALIDVKVAEAETPLVESTPQNATQSVAVNKILDYGDADALVDICIKQAKEFPEHTLEIPQQEKGPIVAEMSPFPSVSLVPNSEKTSSKLLSPELTAKFSQPTRFTPRKSSSKKQATVPKMAHISDNNKENIDNNSEKEVEPRLAKVKKNKSSVIDDEIMQNLDVCSLRQLKKLTKKFDKLQIAENMKNKEEKHDCKDQEKTRPALQILSQNCMHAGKKEKEN